MVRYLSAAWFERLREYEAADGAPALPPGDAIVLRQVVTGTPEGPDATYDVVIAAGTATVRAVPEGPADLTFRSDYPTAAAIATGRLAVLAALADGCLKVAGDMSTLAGHAAVAGLDPLPAGLRSETEP